MRTPIKPILASSLATLMLAACSMAPSYERPEAPVSAQFPIDSAAMDADRAAADVGWREVFTDPRLQAVIELALENNRDLRLAALNVEATRAQYRIQRASQLPGLGAQVDASRQRIPSGVVQDGVPAPAQGGVIEQYSAGLGLTAFEIDLFGRVRSLRDAALAEFLASEQARRSAHISLVAAVAGAYLSEREAVERVQLSQQSLEAWEESGRLARLRYDAGVGSALDLAESDTLVQTARADLAAATRAQAQAGNLLVLLVGQPLPADLPEARPLAENEALADLPVGLPSQLIERRPDILEAEQALLAANANIGAARAAFFPRLSLTGFLGSASSEFSNLFESGTRTWLFAPQITMPIFDAGANRANLDLAWVRRDAAVAGYERAIQEAFREVADGLAARDTFNQQIQAQQALLDAASRRAELVGLRFESGVDSSLALLDAERSRYAAQQALLAVRLQQQASLVDLYRALGGGWSADAIEPVPQRDTP